MNSSPKLGKFAKLNSEFSTVGMLTEEFLGVHDWNWRPTVEISFAVPSLRTRWVNFFFMPFRMSSSGISENSMAKCRPSKATIYNTEKKTLLIHSRDISNEKELREAFLGNLLNFNIKLPPAKYKFCYGNAENCLLKCLLKSILEILRLPSTNHLPHSLVNIFFHPPP